ncbi:hypothetical protein GCM10027419_27630 [Pandoraea terrae]
MSWPPNGSEPPVGSTFRRRAFGGSGAVFFHRRHACGRVINLCSLNGVNPHLYTHDARYVTGNTLFVDGGGHANGVQWAPAVPD